jgi:hypothetical protein
MFKFADNLAFTCIEFGINSGFIALAKTGKYRKKKAS